MNLRYEPEAARWHIDLEGEPKDCFICGKLIEPGMAWYSKPGQELTCFEHTRPSSEFPLRTDHIDQVPMIMDNHLLNIRVCLPVIVEGVSK